jgi:hypothetical protein
MHRHVYGSLALLGLVSVACGTAEARSTPAAGRQAQPQQQAKPAQTTSQQTMQVTVTKPAAGAQQSGAPAPRGASSYAPVNEDDFDTVRQRMSAARAGVEAAHKEVLARRYDLADKPRSRSAACSPRASCRCRTPTNPRAACSFRSRPSTTSRSRPAAI